MARGATMWLLPLLFAGVLSTKPSTSDEYKLRKDLVKRTDETRKDMVPISGSLNQSVTVKHGIALIHLLDFSEKTREFTGHFFTRLRWTDSNMVWSPEEYNGISDLRIKTQNLWNPDIVLYNSMDFDTKEYMDAMKVLYSNGDILWIPNSHYSVLCDPADDDEDGEWKCSFKFGSWVYDDSTLNFQFYEDLEEVDMTDFKENAYWKVVSAPAIRTEKKYPCCEETYTDITYNLLLTRTSAANTASHSLLCVPALLATLLVNFWSN